MSRLLRRPALAAALLLGTVVAARAHAHLKAAVPAAESILATAPTELDLTFTEGVNLPFTGVTVTGPGGIVTPTGPASHGPGGNSTVMVPVAVPLGAGTYKVDWHALAIDGHKTTGSYGFTIKP